MMFHYVILIHINVILSVDCFFFKQKTAYEMRISDWSSDVCSSDLPIPTPDGDGRAGRMRAHRKWRSGSARPPSARGSASSEGQADKSCGGRTGWNRQGTRPPGDRKSGGEGKGVSVRVDLVGRRPIKNTK